MTVDVNNSMEDKDIGIGTYVYTDIDGNKQDVTVYLDTLFLDKPTIKFSDGSEDDWVCSVKGNLERK